MNSLYNIEEVFNTRLGAIRFYRSIYLFTNKFKVLKMDLFLEEEEDKFKVLGNVLLMKDYKGLTEVDIINHIKKSI